LYISVIGASECDKEMAEVAYKLGWEIARRHHVLVCGGLGGVMDAAAHGAHDANGFSVGILPGADRTVAGKWLSVAIPTDMGHARNALVALSGDAVIAVGGGFGTLSEIAFGLKMGKPVIGLGTWESPQGGNEERWCAVVSTPEEAVALAERLAGLTRS
jgi:uncharacterized protein (TIGR00725 family)